MDQLLLYKGRFYGLVVLGSFPKAFSQVKNSQVATFQMFNFSSGNFPKVRLGPLRPRRLQWGPSAAARMG